MTHFSISTSSESDTERLGILLSGTLGPGSIVSLNGPLGAGKTRLVQAIARGLGIESEEVTSPTFVLIHEYRSGQLPLFHFDAYRVADDDEFAELGPEDYFFGDGVAIVEWGDRVARFFPPQVIHIEITIEGTARRNLTITANSDYLQRVREAIASAG